MPFIYFRGAVSLGSQQKAPLAGDITTMKKWSIKYNTKFTIIQHYYSTCKPSVFPANYWQLQMYLSPRDYLSDMC